MDSEFWHFPHLSLACFPLRLDAPGIILGSKESLCLRAGALPVREPTDGPGDPGKSWSGLGASPTFGARAVCSRGSFGKPGPAGPGGAVARTAAVGRAAAAVWTGDRVAVRPSGSPWVEALEEES